MGCKGKFSKVFCGLIICCAAMLFMTEKVSADVIFEPLDNSFYADNSEECEYIFERKYIVNSPKGYTVYSSKPDGSARGTIKNGDKVTISFLYTDEEGKEWGYIMYPGEEEGWIAFEDVFVEYDFLSFEEEYKDRITVSETGVPVELNENTVMWKYPGSEAYTLLGFTPEESISFWELFTDEDGNEWGFLGYYRGRRNQWVCLTSPEATDMPVREIETPEVIEVTDIEEPDIGSEDVYLIIIVIGAVILIAALSVTLMVVLRKKNGR